MNIAIAGTGYVGLVSGTCFAEMGAHVACIDICAKKIELLKQGEIPLYEPGLDDMLRRNRGRRRLTFDTDITQYVNHVDIFFIAVGTPSSLDGTADMSALWDVVEKIGRHMTRELLIVTKSTVPVGTARLIRQRLERVLKDRGMDFPFDVASNPEFLKEGAAVQDFMNPDRVILGVDSKRAADLLGKLYNPFMLNDRRLILMSTISAEMTKYVSNAMLATRISMMNETAFLCEALGANINQVREGVGSDSRIGRQFLHSGCGYGGSCFPKDIRALYRVAKEHGCGMDILEAVERVNERQKKLLFEKMEKALSLHGKNEGKVPSELHVCLWGLSFKPETDDIREAPAMTLISQLLSHGYKVSAYDPQAMNNTGQLFENTVSFCEDMYSAAQGADILILVTEWNVFRQPSWNRLRVLMRGNCLIDGRNLYQRAEVEREGFFYYGIGC